VTIVKPGAISQNKIMPKSPPVYPTGFAELLAMAINAIRDTSGVNVEMLGMADRQQSGVLEYQRKQAGITILASLFDALRRYRKEQGRNLIYLIKHYISDGRLIRIVGKDGAKYLPLTKVEGAEKYDIVVDEAPSSPNMKEKTWQVLQSLLPMLVQANVPIPPEAMQYLPLPQSLLDSFKPDEKKQAEAQAQKQLQQRGQVAQVSKVESEVRRNDAAAQKDMAQAQEAAQPGQPERPDPSSMIRAHNDTVKTQNDIHLDNARFAMDRSRAQADQALAFLKTAEEIKAGRIKARQPNQRVH
jgi:hypothetical protein